MREDTGQRSILPTFKQFRLKQIRFSARLFKAATRTGVGSAIITSLQQTAPTRAGVNWLLGYNRLFKSFDAARKQAQQFLREDHSHSDNAARHLHFPLRPSDYPVLFHLSRLSKIETVFDLGGNAGNLFYAYDPYLRFPPAMQWRVLDVPSIAAIGRSIAQQRGERRLAFAETLREAEGVDVLLVSGSLLYFEENLHQMLAGFAKKPSCVILNRTPLTDGDPAYTIQDAVTYLLPCKVHNRAELLHGMEELGYTRVDQWTDPASSVIIPSHPKRSVHTYSGYCWKLRE